MTYGKDNNGNVVLTLSEEESKAFENDIVVVKQTASSRGVTEITVRKKVSYPSLTTKVFLNAYLHKDVKDICQLSVKAAKDHLVARLEDRDYNKIRPMDYRKVVNDLEVLESHGFADVPVNSFWK